MAPAVVRLALSALVAIAPALPVAAQTGMPPRSIMLVDWERQKKNVLAYIDAMPDSAITFSPTPGVRNFAEQIEHFVGTNTEIAAVTLRGLKQPPTLGDTAAYRHKKPALRDYTTKSYDYLLESLRTATPAQLSKSFTLFNQPAAPAWRWLDLSVEGTRRVDVRPADSVPAPEQSHTATVRHAVLTRAARQSHQPSAISHQLPPSVTQRRARAPAPSSSQ